MEGIEEVLPARVAGASQRGDVFPGVFKEFFGEQAAVFAEGDEDDTVEEALGGMYGVLGGIVILVDERVNEVEALVGVVVIEIVAHFNAALLGVVEKVQGAGPPQGRAVEQAFGFEKVEELAGSGGVAEVGQCEFLVGPHGATAMVKADGLVVGENAPGGVG